MGWETESLTYDTMHARLARVCEELVLLNPASVLELGCSVGTLRSELLARLPNVDYWGCDMSSSAVAVIDDPQVTVHDLNDGGMPFPSQRFECVVGSGILEYIDDVPTLLRQIHDSLQPGGSAVLTYYNMFHYSRRIAKYRGRVPWRHPEFRNNYTAGEMLDELHSAGFRDVRETADVMALSRFKFPIPHARAPGRRVFGRNLLYVARRP